MRASIRNRIDAHAIDQKWAFVALLSVLILGSISNWKYIDDLPTALDVSCDETRRPFDFLAERAWRDLLNLTGIGSRLTGGHNNEIQTVEFLRERIDNLKNSAHENQIIDVDFQIASGQFLSASGTTHIYNNVQNIVVKLEGQHFNPNRQGNHSVMISCHFDTVPGSPGASDNAAGCIVMLEVLRVLSKSCHRNRFSTVLVFHGAEEPGQLSSHAFFKQHEWAKDVRALVSLESVGSGGKEIAFQIGRQNSPWLVKAYGRAALHPSSDVLVAELFRLGSIHFDMVFGKSNHYGKIPGLSMTHIANGHRHHTKFDNTSFLTSSVLQHTGDNLLRLTKIMSNSYNLNGKKKTLSSSLVYFDVLGLFFLSYYSEIGIFLNILVAVSAVLVPYWSLARRPIAVNETILRREILYGFFLNLIIFLGSIVLGCVVALGLDFVGRSMMWYSHPIMCIPNYCLVAVFVHCWVHSNHERILLIKDRNTPISVALRTQIRLIGTSLFWSAAVLLLTFAGIRSAYILTVPLLISLLSSGVVAYMDYHNSIRKWLYVHVVGQAFVVLWTSSYYHMAMTIFIPMAGRSGGHNNPEYAIAVLGAILTYMAVSFVTPLALLCTDLKTFQASLGCTFIFAHVVVSGFGLSHYGFPYRDEAKGQPAVQRIFVTHTTRTLYDRDGDVRYMDSGYWFQALDRNTLNTIRAIVVPEVPIQQIDNALCKSEAFCGLPIYSPHQLQMGGFWVPSPPHTIKTPAVLKLLSHEKVTTRIQRLKLHLTPRKSRRIALHIRPGSNVALKRWSLTQSLPPPTISHKDKAYLVMITYGLEAPSMEIVLDFETPTAHYECAIAEISMVEYHWEYENHHAIHFNNLLSKTPRWAEAIPAVSALTSWTF